MGAAGGIIGGGLGVGVVAGSVYQGLQQRRAQRRGERATEYAQEQATRRAAAEVKRQRDMEAKQNRKKPDVQGLLGREREAALTGAGATTLTGSNGVIRNSLMLGKASMLGGS